MIIENKMKSCKEVYEKKMFENEKVHVKVEELNSEAFQVNLSPFMALK